MRTLSNNNMEKPIIEIRNIGKKYNITHMRGGYIALRDVIANVFKNPFRFATHKVKHAIGLSKREEFWALKDINLSIKKGEVIGIIGANGAGKSTLLKILTGITPPTEGEIVMRGRVSSLLEVGTGFHPELSGRENIFLNGAILGMTKAEIEKNFDAIVKFAGIEKFLDTPVKRYSSGMYVRLAFSVAAHMEPDILLVDEVLAVGDAEFQKKCLGKMEEVTQEQGRTIFFVSHNMSAIQSICTRCILLEQGRIVMDGDPEETIAQYLQNKTEYNLSANKKLVTDTGEIEDVDVWIENQEGKKVSHVSSGEDMRVVIKFKPNFATNKTINFALALINRQTNEQLADIWNTKGWETIPDESNIVCTLPKLPLNTGTYALNLCIKVNGFVSYWVKDMVIFDVNFGDFYKTGKLPDPKQGSFLFEQIWKTE